MLKMIGRITALFGINRDERNSTRKRRKPQKGGRDTDVITISSEARRLNIENQWNNRPADEKIGA